MKVLKRYSFLMAILLAAACVTINVYFPAAAAESAADKIIKEVYGKDEPVQEHKQPATDPDQSSTPEPQGLHLMGSIINILIPATYAQQPDLNISTPGIERLKSMMTSRHQQLSPFYASGAVGMENNGLISIREESAISLKDRNTVKKLVADENRDRNAMYAEIAKANGHPEWEDQIRDTFARRWVANAPRGWWYIGASGSWQQK